MLNRAIQIGWDPLDVDEHFHLLFDNIPPASHFLDIPRAFASDDNGSMVGFHHVNNGTVDTLGHLISMSPQRMDVIRFTNAVLPSKVSMC